MPNPAKLNATQQRLLENALAAMKNAHIVWGFSVGAAVLAEDNKIYEGCNVESQISGLGICAERCAIDHAILHGNKAVKEIAVVIAKEDAESPTPCGACLQYIHDFSDGKATVITASEKDGRILKNSVSVRRISELLPFPFKSFKN